MKLSEKTIAESSVQDLINKHAGKAHPVERLYTIQEVEAVAREAASTCHMSVSEDGTPHSYFNRIWWTQKKSEMEGK